MRQRVSGRGSACGFDLHVLRVHVHLLHRGKRPVHVFQTQKGTRGQGTPNKVNSVLHPAVILGKNYGSLYHAM